MPRPGLLEGPFENASPTAYFGLRLAAAVNLLEAREYNGMPRAERLNKALTEQQVFLNGLLDPSLSSAFDLRLIVDPARSPAIEIVVLGRTWASAAADAEGKARELVRHLQASLPRHVIGEVMQDEAVIAAALSPFADPDSVESVVITKNELVALPTRPDAKVAYYFSVVPFSWADSDWTNLYSSLAASPIPLVLSVGLLPLRLPESFSEHLHIAATQYGRLAREDERDPGVFYGRQKLPPDPFAIDGERVFRDFVRRYSGRAFVMRIQISAAGRLPVGIVEAVAATISPPDAAALSHLEHERGVSAYELRPARTTRDQALARWNLQTVDFRLIPGRPAIWARPDPPPQDFQLLAVLGDARDANCCWRFPIAVDGTVPGFRVRRGQFGQVERYQSDRPSISLGGIPGGGGDVTLAVDSLTKHALVAGSPGAGKTTTVIEILRQVWLDHHRPFLVIEPVNSDADDYRKLLGIPGFDALTVYTVGDEGGRPLRFNPFEVPKNVLVAEHIANLLACFKAGFGLWEPLPSIYQDALNRTYLKAGILGSEHADGSPRTWPTAVEFMNSMRAVTKDLGYAGEVKHNIEAASIRRAEQLARGTSASVFLTDKPNNIDALLEAPVILELKSLGQGDEQALMMALLLNAITESYQATRGASSRLEHLTVIEEAHRLLSRPSGGKAAEEAQAKEKAAEAFANSLAENRKYGEGMIIAEQVPTKLVEDAVKNTNLKVMHRLTAEDDRQYLGETMGFDEAQMRFATRLTTGEALVYSDEFAEAIEIKVHPGPTSPTPPPVPPSPSPPFAACDPCRSPCLYRGAALAIVRDPDIVEDVRKVMGTIQTPGLPGEEIGRAWAELLALLRERVTAFSALPSSEPAVSDAAYCLFLHALGIRTMLYRPSWPTSTARHLGILGEAEVATNG